MCVIFYSLFSDALTLRCLGSSVFCRSRLLTLTPILYAERMYPKNVVSKNTHTEISIDNEQTRPLVESELSRSIDRSSSQNISVSASETTANLKEEIVDVYAHYLNSGMRRKQIRAAFQSHLLNIMKERATNIANEMDSGSVSRASLEATTAYFNAVNDIRQQSQQSFDTTIGKDRMEQKKLNEKNVNSDKMDNEKKQSFNETNLDNITLPVNEMEYVVSPLLSLASEKFRNENHPTAITSVCTRVDDLNGVSTHSLKDDKLVTGKSAICPNFENVTDLKPASKDRSMEKVSGSSVKAPVKMENIPQSGTGKSAICPNFENVTDRKPASKDRSMEKVIGSSVKAPVKMENIPESGTGKSVICPNFENVTDRKPVSKDRGMNKVIGSSMKAPVKMENIPESGTGKSAICPNFENVTDPEDTDMDEMIDKLINASVDLENIPEELRYRAIYHDMIVNVLMNKNFKRNRKPIDSRLINVPTQPLCIDHILMRCENEKANAKELDEIPIASLKKRTTREKDIDFEEILDYESVVSKGSKQIEMSRKSIYDLVSTSRTLPQDFDTLPESMMRTWITKDIIDSPLTRSLRKQKKLNVEDETREMLSDSGYASGMACEIDVADVKCESSISDLIPPKGYQAENRKRNSTGRNKYCELTAKDELPKRLNEEVTPSVSGELENRKIGVDHGKNTVRDSVNQHNYKLRSFTKPDTVTVKRERKR
ncbi:hypothetical protein T10_11621 [Trichinella papuae]|uniref:Uncharacterized protein n=1 Tax=Trichinella papuae TaxID=268474 RepID=A0A0V1MDZ5_9BILA|nr:hypothetical protein T10_11621 [Trichinella papuae]